MASTSSGSRGKLVSAATRAPRRISSKRDKDEIQDLEAELAAAAQKTAKISDEKQYKAFIKDIEDKPNTVRHFMSLLPGLAHLDAPAAALAEDEPTLKPQTNKVHLLNAEQFIRPLCIELLPAGAAFFNWIPKREPKQAWLALLCFMAFVLQTSAIPTRKIAPLKVWFKERFEKYGKAAFERFTWPTAEQLVSTYGKGPYLMEVFKEVMRTWVLCENNTRLKNTQNGFVFELVDDLAGGNVVLDKPCDFYERHIKKGITIDMRVADVLERAKLWETLEKPFWQADLQSQPGPSPSPSPSPSPPRAPSGEAPGGHGGAVF
eukprot:TRINITY_DN64721_c0_g1_i1.p1 TRINITY_DN64721_c0_g1~~TRINITY_DN64721_c0_g1_i1.p1  ORF type:complete len:319 (-),score=73.35 TRINITY_DN64721_c0_g1_i1:140-1096(-)